MFALTRTLRKVPFHRVSTKPLRTPFGDMPVTWNTEPMEPVGAFADDRKPIYSRKCSCILNCGECWCAIPMNEEGKLWML